MVTSKYEKLILKPNSNFVLFLTVLALSDPTLSSLILHLRASLVLTSFGSFENFFSTPSPQLILRRNGDGGKRKNLQLLLPCHGFLLIMTKKIRRCCCWAVVVSGFLRIMMVCLLSVVDVSLQFPYFCWDTKCTIDDHFLKET